MTRHTMDHRHFFFFVSCLNSCGFFFCNKYRNFILSANITKQFFFYRNESTKKTFCLIPMLQTNVRASEALLLLLLWKITANGYFFFFVNFFFIPKIDNTILSNFFFPGKHSITSYQRVLFTTIMSQNRAFIFIYLFFFFNY